MGYFIFVMPVLDDFQPDFCENNARYVCECECLKTRTTNDSKVFLKDFPLPVNA